MEKPYLVSEHSPQSVRVRLNHLNLEKYLDSVLSVLSAALDSKASNLSSLSKKYRSDAKYLNTRSTYAKVAIGAVIFITLIVYVRFWWL